MLPREYISRLIIRAALHRGRLWDEPTREVAPLGSNMSRSPMKVAPHRIAPSAPPSAGGSSNSHAATGGAGIAKLLAGQAEKRPQSARAATPSSGGGSSVAAKLAGADLGTAGAAAPGAGKGSLAARLALAAGVGGKGFKSIADIAKPSMSTGMARKLITATPLDTAMTNSMRAREDAKRAMAEGEINLTKMYSRDHDGMVTARALLVGSTKSLTRLVTAADVLEQEAAKARAQLQAGKTISRARVLPLLLCCCCGCCWSLLRF